MKAFRYILIIFLFLGLNSETHSQIDYFHFDSNRAEKLMFAAINRVRLENDLPLLKSDKTLKRMADSHALDMIHRDFFDHINHDGESPRDRAKKLGIPFPVSENLGVLSSYGIPLEKVVEQFLESLLESPDHRANILNPRITDIGISFKQDKDQKTTIIDLKQISDSKLGYGTIVLCQTFMKRSFKKLSPDPFPSNIYSGDSIHIFGETYRDFDSILIELQDIESQRIVRTTEVILTDRRFEDNLIFTHKGKYDIRIAGKRFNDKSFSIEELAALNLFVE